MNLRDSAILLVCYTDNHMVPSSAPLRVLALTHCAPSEPCTFARIFTPLRILQAGGKVEYALEPIWPWRAAAFQRIMRELPQWDVVWVARPRHYLILPLMQEARRIGVPVLVDIDDWLLEQPDSYGATQWCGTRTSQETMRAALHLADAVTASTPVIAERCAALGIQSHIIPNAIDREQFTRQPHNGNILTIAFCGTIAHRDDVPLIAPALRRLLATHMGRIQVISVGCAIPGLQGIEGYTHYDFVAATAYPQMLSNLRVDIGLAPLYDTPFNEARSDIKYLEYSATGAATIASAVTPYKESIGEDRGILVLENTPEGWAAAILDLVENTNQRQLLADNAYTWVCGSRSIEAMSDIRYALFRDYAVNSESHNIMPGQTSAAPTATMFKHVVLRQLPYYGRELPHLLMLRMFADIRTQAKR